MATPPGENLAKLGVSMMGCGCLLTFLVPVLFVILLFVFGTISGGPSE